MKDALKYLLYTGMTLLYFAYTATIYRLPEGSESSSKSEILAGKALWQEKNCMACHQIYGLGGFLGPDLTNVYSAPGKGPGYIAAFVKSGTLVMPAFPLSDEEMSSLNAFMEHIDASGIADPKSFTIKPDGTIEQRKN